MRQGMERCEIKLQQMGITKDKGKHVIDAHTVNTRSIAGDTRQVYLTAKARNQGYGNILDHGTISGEFGVLG